MIVLFGHQSVGAGLLTGIHELAAKGVATPRIAELAAPVSPDAGPVVAAFRIGRNRDPDSKLRHFAEVARSAGGANAQIALFKFCYVDLCPATDPDALFDRYQETLDRIRAERPKLRLAHVTVPLQSAVAGAAARIGRWFGARNRRREANAVRHAFNQRMRARCRSAEPLFDLAAIQCGVADVPPRSGHVPALASRFSSDGGHLNALGRRIVALAFLDFLAGIGAGAHALRPGDPGAAT